MRIPNLSKLSTMLIPPILRSDLLVRYASLLSVPFGSAVTGLDKQSIEVRNRLRRNGQVCKLRALLNDMFDKQERRITITDGVSNAGVIVFSRSANIEQRSVYSREKNETDSTESRFVIKKVFARGTSAKGVDFYVNIPADIDTEQTRINIESVVNNYRLATKTFKIQTL